MGADLNTPPLPPGFTLDNGPQASATPPLPPGFQLDAPQQEQPGMLDQIARQLGLTARYGLEGAGNMASLVTEPIRQNITDPIARMLSPDPTLSDLVTGNTQAPQGESLGAAAARFSDYLGLPKPQGALEEGVANASRALVGTGMTAGVGLGVGAPQLAAQPAMQAFGTMTGAGAQDIAREAGAGQGGQMAAGIAGSLIPGGAQAGFNAVRTAPERTIAALTKNAGNTEFAQEGRRLRDATGVQFTPAQESGSKAATMAENATRQSIFSMDKAFAGDRARIGQLAAHFDKTLEGITRSNASPAAAGAQVQGTVKKMVRDLEDWRNTTANEDFGRIRQMTRGSATIQPESTNALLQKLLQDNEGVGAASTDAVANWARKNLANVDPSATANANALAEKIGNFPISKQLTDAAALTSPAQGNLDKLMKLRQFASKVAGGQQKISGDNEDRRIGAMLLKSIDEDIEKAGDTIGGDLGGALKMANARYREVSQQIEGIKASPLGKILGEDVAGAMQSGQFNTIAPEVVMEKISRLKPTELGIVRGMLEQDQPQTWKILKKSLLESHIDQAMQMPGSAGANTAALNPVKLISKNMDANKLKAVYDPSELSEITAGFDAARRLGDKTGYNFSGTAAQQEVLSLMNSLKTATLKGVANVAGAALGSRKMAQIMSEPAGRRAVIELERRMRTGKPIGNLATQISMIANADQ